MSTEQLAVTVRAMRTIGRLEYQSKVLTALALRLPERERSPVFTEALSRTIALHRASATARSFDKRKEMVADDSIEPSDAGAAGGADRSTERVFVLGAPIEQRRLLIRLVPHLPEDLFEPLLSAVPILGTLENQAIVLGSLAPRLPAGHLVRARVIADGIADPAVRCVAGTLVALQMQLSDESHASAITESVVATDNIRDIDFLLWTLRELAPRIQSLPDATSLFTRLLPAEEDWSTTGVSTLRELAPYLPVDMVSQLWDAASNLDNWRTARVEALAVLAPYLPTSTGRSQPFSKVLEEGANTSGRDRFKIVEIVAQDLPEDLLERALRFAAGINEADLRAQAVVTLAPRLPADLIDRAIESVDLIREPGYRAWVLSALAPRLPVDIRDLAFSQVLAAAADNGEQAQKSLVALAPHLPLDLLEMALPMAANIVDPGYRAAALAALAPRVPIERRHLLFSHAFEAGAAHSRGAVCNVLLSFVENCSSEARATAVESLFQVIQWWP